MRCNGNGSCNFSPCPHERHFTLFCKPEARELTMIAEGYYVDKEAAYRDLMDWWDPELDSASCSPVILDTTQGRD